MSTLERTFQKGIRQGKAEGYAAGRVALLLRQLRKRFGDAVTTETERRVLAADLDALDRIGERLLDAATIDDVFVDPA